MVVIVHGNVSKGESSVSSLAGSGQITAQQLCDLRRFVRPPVGSGTKIPEPIAFYCHKVFKRAIISTVKNNITGELIIFIILVIVRATGTAPRTAGILEMGGQSTQIAFIPSGNVLGSKFPVHIGSCRYSLYVHSYLHYGQLALGRRLKERLMSTTEGQLDVINPCMQNGCNILYYCYYCYHR